MIFRRLLKYGSVGLLFLAFISLFLLNRIANAEETKNKKIRVELVEPIMMDKSSEAAAKFAEVTDEGRKYGLTNYKLVGDIDYEKLDDGSTRTIIRWHSVSSTGATQITENLNSPLRSQFRTKDERVPVPEKLWATGDLDQLVEDLAKAQKELEDKESATKEKESESKETYTGIAPSGSSGTSGTSTTSDTSDASISADKLITTYEDCNDYIDISNMKVHYQRKKVVTSESGAVQEVGGCETYRTQDIETKPGDCGYQWDFETGQAVEMVQPFYVKDTGDNAGEEILVGECRASGNTYPLVEATYDCPVQIDEANMKAWPQKRMGIDVGNATFFATDCQPIDDNTYYTLKEELCDPDNPLSEINWDHDYTNHKSYLLTRKYYQVDDDPNNEKIFVGTCSRSPSVSYDHKYDDSECGWIMDDENLQGQLYSKTFIVTEWGNATISDCAPHDSPTAYSFLGIVDNATIFYATSGPGSLCSNPSEYNKVPEQVFVVPADVLRIYVDAAAGGGVAAGGGRAGQYIQGRMINVTPGESISLWVGVGGLRGYCSPAPYKTIEGSDTVFGTSDNSFEPIVLKYAQGHYPINKTGGAGLCVQADNFCTSYGEGKIYDYTLPPSGSGYGAGGGGASYANQYTYVYRNGIGGVVRIKFKTMKYMRPDGTYHYVVYNGD